MTDTRPHFWFQIIEDYDSATPILCGENLNSEVKYYYGTIDNNDHYLQDFDFEEYDNIWVAPNSFNYLYDNVIFFVVEENEYDEIINIIMEIGSPLLENILNNYPNLQYRITNNFSYPNGEGYIGELIPTGSWSINNKQVQSLVINNKEVQTIERISDGAILYQALRDYVVINDITKYYRGSERFVVTCYEDGEPVYNKSVSFYINDHPFPRTTDENGQASLPLNFSPGIYSMVTTIDEEVYYNTVTILSTVQAEDVEVYYGGDNTISATCLDTTGQPVNNIEMKCNVNGEFYYATTDSNGYVEFSIPQLESDDYIASIINESTGEVKVINFIVKPTIISSDLTKYYKCSQQFEPVFLDSAGDYITDTSLKVHFSIYHTDNNGNWIDPVHYERIIGRSSVGVAKLNINLPPGIYGIETTNPITNETVSNNITVISVMYGNDLVMKYEDGSRYRVLVLDCNGDPLEGATVEFNINGVTANRLSNSDGIAQYNINLMVGEYIITSSYNGLKITNTITITA